MKTMGNLHASYLSMRRMRRSCKGRDIFRCFGLIETQSKDKAMRVYRNWKLCIKKGLRDAKKLQLVAIITTISRNSASNKSISLQIGQKAVITLEKGSDVSELAIYSHQKSGISPYFRENVSISPNKP